MVRLRMSVAAFKTLDPHGFVFAEDIFHAGWEARHAGRHCGAGRVPCIARVFICHR
jgi:hypothetical protein